MTIRFGLATTTEWRKSTRTLVVVDSGTHAKLFGTDNHSIQKMRNIDYLRLLTHENTASYQIKLCKRARGSTEVEACVWECTV